MVNEKQGQAVFVEVLLKKATDFLNNYYAEKQLDGLQTRLNEVADAITNQGTYQHTYDELSYGAKMAWRNSNRCIGRLFWKTLKVRDMRHVKSAQGIFDEVVTHLKTAINGGQIRSVITIFENATPLQAQPLQFWNKQILRYAGYQQADGHVIGDPSQIQFTQLCQQLGWQGKGGAFDILPVVIQPQGQKPSWYSLPSDCLHEVLIEHPKLSWFKNLGLKWHALPVISDMVLEIGGLYYTAAPFNGWYMLNEIASRNLGDAHRYNMLPKIAQCMGLDTSPNNPLWRDRALVELNEAVLYSFQRDGVSLTDHHTASNQFMHFAASEHKNGRKVNADWAWITPPMSSSTTQVFHELWDNQVLSPNFYYNFTPWETPDHDALTKAKSCPFHINH